jgi:SAM-dependent methyltransferase
MDDADPSGPTAPVGSLSEAWRDQASNWIAWARTFNHDSYDLFHRDAFARILPEPGRLTLDVGCGEGRFTRFLSSLGHRVIGVEQALESAEAAAAAGSCPIVAGDAARLPIADGAADLITSLLVLQDLDDLDGAVAEMARVLAPGGTLCVACVHPINSSGRFAASESAAPFVIGGSYFEQRRIADLVERDGLRIVFHAVHRPLQDIIGPMLRAGLVIEEVREVPDPTPGDKWNRLPLFLHLRLRRRVEPAGDQPG